MNVPAHARACLVCACAVAHLAAVLGTGHDSAAAASQDKIRFDHKTRGSHEEDKVTEHGMASWVSES